MGWEVLNLRRLNFSKPLFVQFSSLFYLPLPLRNVHAFMVCISILTAPHYCLYFSIAPVPPEAPLSCPYTLNLCIMRGSFSL